MKKPAGVKKAVVEETGVVQWKATAKKLLSQGSADDLEDGEADNRTTSRAQRYVFEKSKDQIRAVRGKTNLQTNNE